MRKYLMIVVAAIISALAITSFAQADDIQSITGEADPGEAGQEEVQAGEDLRRDPDPGHGRRD